MKFLVSAGLLDFTSFGPDNSNPYNLILNILAPTDVDYYEGWVVTNGSVRLPIGIDTTGKSPSGYVTARKDRGFDDALLAVVNGKGPTAGYTVITGQANFFPFSSRVGKRTVGKLDWKLDGVPEANGLPSSYGKPAWWSSSGSLDHSIKVVWDTFPAFRNQARPSQEQLDACITSITTTP